MSSNLSPALKSILDEAGNTIFHITITRYACAIGMTILCYDTMLTFGDEVRLIWGSQWNTTKLLLYFNRILAFFFLLLNTWHLAGFRPSLDDTTCDVIVQATGKLYRVRYQEGTILLLVFTAYAAIFSYCIANWMLLLRVSALYGHNRILFWILTIFWIVSYIATLTTMSITARSLQGQITYSVLLDVCLIPQIPSTLSAVWVSPIAFEIITFLMSLYKIWGHARASGDLKSNPLLRVLYLDSVRYFFVIMGIRLFNLICWLIFPVSLIFVGVFILWSLIIVMIDRLFLDLRHLYKDQNRTVDCEGRKNPNTEAEENLRRTQTPFTSRFGAQSTNISTMMHDKG